MTTDSPVVVLFNSDGYEVNVKPGVAIPAGTTAIIAAGTDGTNSRFILVDSSGRPVIVGAGTAGSPVGGVVSIQGVASGTPIPISGTVTAANASIGITGAAIPASATQIGGSDGTNLQVPRVFDADSGGGTQYVLGVNLRLSSSGGSVEFGTNTNPIRIDPTGTTTQPISAATLPLPTGAATEATLATLLTTSAFQARINTLGQKTMANSTPVVLASDQTVIPVSQSGTWTVQPGNTANTTPWLATINQGGNSATVTASNALKVDGSAVTQPVSGTITANQGGSWTVTANAGTGNFNVIGTASDNSTNSTAKLPVLPARANTAAPTWTDGLQVPLSVDTTGALRITGSISASNASIGINGAAIPTSSTLTAGTDGTNLQPFRVFDVDSGAGTQYVQGISLRLSASGGSVEFGTATNPIRIDPTGTTTQPVSGTVTANAGTGNFTVVQATPANLNATVVQGTAANLRAQTASESATGATTPATAGLAGGTVTTAAPTYTTGNLGALSLTTGGLLRVDGSGITQPVSGTVAATQSGTWTVQPGNTANTTPWLATINQGGNSATVTASNALKVDGSAVTQPVSGTVAATQSGAWTVTANAGTGNFTVIGTGTDNTANSTAKLPVLVARANTSAPTWTDTNMVPLSVDTSGALRITGSISASNASIGSNGAAIPTSSTQIGGSDGTNLQALRVFDTDTGAGTQYLLGINLRLSASGGSVEFGTATNPIRIDPTGTTTQPVSGTVTANAGTGNFTVVQATAANLRSQTASESATGSATPATAGLSGGAVTTAAPTYTTGNLGALSLTTGGLLRVDGSGVTQPISGTVAATQSGTWTVQPGNTANTTPWLATINQGGNSATVTASNALKIDGSAVTQPVSGTVTANQGGSWTVTANAGTGNFNVVGTASDNSTNSTAKLPVLPARANTSAPTWTDGNQVPLSVDTAGALRVTGSITANNASVSTTGTAPPGSATYIGGSVTTAAPTYTTGQMNALSLTTGGLLRVDGSGTTQPVSGTVTVTQSTPANLRAQTSSESNTGSAVPTQAAMIGGSDGTNLRALRVLTDGTLQTRYKELATFTLLSTATSPGNNKSMLSITNGSGSTVKVRISAIYMVNVQGSAVTGVAGTFELRRCTSHASGTAITTIETMDTGDSLNGSITARTNATITGESSTLLWRSLFSTDEWGPGGADVESATHDWQTFYPVWVKKDNDNKPIILNANEGLTVKFATNSSVGSFDIMMVFTQE